MNDGVPVSVDFCAAGIGEACGKNVTRKSKGHSPHASPLSIADHDFPHTAMAQQGDNQPKSIRCPFFGS